MSPDGLVPMQVDLHPECLLPSVQPGFVPGFGQHQRPHLLHWQHHEAGRRHHLLSHCIQEPHLAHECCGFSHCHSGYFLVLTSEGSARKERGLKAAPSDKKAGGGAVNVVAFVFQSVHVTRTPLVDEVLTSTSVVEVGAGGGGQVEIYDSDVCPIVLSTPMSHSYLEAIVTVLFLKA